MAFPGFRFTPKHCCECSPAVCLIVKDDFDAAGDLSKWVVRSGTWTVSDDSLLCSEAGLITLIKTAAHWDDPIHVQTFIRRLSGDPVKTRLIVAYVDADTYLFGEHAYNVAGNSGTLRIGSRIGGSERWYTAAVDLLDDTELADKHPLTLCWVPPQPQEIEHLSNSGWSSECFGMDWGNPDGAMVQNDGSVADFGVSVVITATTILSKRFVGFMSPGSTINRVDISVVCRTTGSVGTATLTLLQLARNGNLIGSDLGTGQVLSTTFISLGGQLPDFSGFDWENFNDGEITVDVGFGYVGTLPNLIEVDLIDLDIYYTTPDKSGGKLTLSLRNVEVSVDPLYQCAEDLILWESEGSIVGIQNMAGSSWEYSSFTLNYLRTKALPFCPRCLCGNADDKSDWGQGDGWDESWGQDGDYGDGGGDATCITCCDEALLPPRRVLLDLGGPNLMSGGISICNDDFCTYADGIKVLTFSSDCSWELVILPDPFDPRCTNDKTVYYFKSIIYTVTLIPVFGAGACRWVASIAVFRWFYTPGIFNPVINSYAIYSGPADVTPATCRTGPVTLTKNRQLMGIACVNGEYPDTIELDFPPP